MNSILYADIGTKGAGFTNQIFSIITAIIIANSQGKKFIIFDNFSNHYTFSKEVTTSCISDILDINRINHFLKKYNVIIIDKNFAKLCIEKAEYGYGNNIIDLTNIIKKLYYNSVDNTFCINKNVNLNDLNGDPIFGIPKKLTIKYNINNHLIIEEYNEIRNFDICFDLTKCNYLSTFGWINSFNKEMFNDILINLSYQYKYKEISDNFINAIPNNYIINIIHLRIENDAITHWSKMNKMSQDDYKNYITRVYINLIQQFIDKKSMNIILSYSTDNAVLDFLQSNNYKYKLTDKIENKREINALIDLLVAKNCNGTFIGNFNIQQLNGSSFSYYISKILQPNIKQIFIDLDNITKESQIYIPESIYIYFHICTIGNWKKVVTNIYNLIFDTKLIDCIDRIKITVLGNELEAVKEILNHEKVEIIFHSTNTNLYERPCLNLLSQHCRDTTHNFRVLYLHSKGVTRYTNPNVQDWIDLLCYFNIENYPTCLEHLNYNDTVGINIDTNNPNPHYSGNFWWANSNYIKKLPETIGSAYLDPELWIGKASGKMHSLWNSKIDHYQQPYPSNKYKF